MPALPSVSDVLRIVYHIGIGSDLSAIVTDHRKFSGTAPTNADLNALASAIAASYAAHLVHDFTADRVLHEIDITDLTSAAAAVGQWLGSHAGTRTDVALPADTSLIFQRKVGRRYRGGHSRQYWPMGGDTSVATPQTWDPVFTAQVMVDMGDLEVDTAAGFWSGAVDLGRANVSYYLGFTNVLYPSGRYHVKPTLRGTPLVDLVATVGINPKFGSQRRRQLQSS